MGGIFESTKGCLEEFAVYDVDFGADFDCVAMGAELCGAFF